MSLIKKILGVMALLLVVTYAFLTLWPGTYNVDNGSMRPGIQIGDKVFTSSQSEYQPGDVITFTAIETDGAQPLVVTHRLVGFNDDGTLITKGDYNKDVDYPAVPLTTSDVIGKVVWHVPVVGGVQMWMGSNLIFVVALTLGLLLLYFVLSKKPKPEEVLTDKDEEPAEAELHPV